ncbi:putative RNA splicing factor [Heterostelium album PN500]|uniref:Pre-mRNA-splicing factor SLU7 n=1 Tax=Heterostelium pallidum (strain ATCC 26659 / Pp 5 / PN500) TaxID=670386 RepID=D3BBU3_HETP5|nr:putative RNA splicing factor [Heterostelium album PN500]EFA81126.1 putative RNA splicing factor [Heterostelium album PN500]|eukprot:XP_020433244.1 putative RNA splicing factor [Heterostelium album PN500]
MASKSETWKKREDWRKQKELEEARKAGTAPAELDEDGKEINPHIPQYITKAPWYVDTNKPSLKHQRAFNKKTDYDKQWYDRGVYAAPAATKFRKGACTNCGAMTHQAKDCCERPRKVGARYTNQDIRPDEVIQSLQLDYDSKRDPYNGYDPESYQDVMAVYEKAEAARKKKRLQEIMKEQNLKEGELNEEELLKQEEDQTFDNEDAALIQKMDPKSRTTVRNLRIREDTAKYLYNLDLDSAHYEPKSRSMRQNPLPAANITDIPFAGDNFTRNTGETKEFKQMQMFSWEASDKGQDVDLSAAPSQAAILHQEFLKKKEQLKNKTKELILNKYGGEESLRNPENGGSGAVDIVPQTEIYQEYSASGKLIKGEEKLTKSKYEEDVYINNHTAVWGSYWENGVWGFQCCKQTIKMSYCTGEAGRKLKEQPTIPISKKYEDKDKQEEEEEEKETVKDDKEERNNSNNSSSKQEKLNKSTSTDERKRDYNSLSSEGFNVTEEEMEAYNLKRLRADDPMANFKDNDD